MHDSIWLIAAAGLGTFLLRYIPLHRARQAGKEHPGLRWWVPFFSAIGPAAIAALLAASLAPDLLSGTTHQTFAALVGVLAVVLVKRWYGGFATATLIGALTYGLLRAALGG